MRVDNSSTRRDEDILHAYLAGDDDALTALCDRYQMPLRRVITAYLDPRIARRVSESDLLQDTWICVVQKLREQRRQPAIAIFPWLRQIAKERVVDAHRRHRGAEARNVYRECHFDPLEASAAGLVDRLADRQSGPFETFARNERRQRLHAALSALKPVHREILVLRFLEQHSLRRCAEILEISAEGAKTRQRRALESLSALLTKESEIRRTSE